MIITKYKQKGTQQDGGLSKSEEEPLTMKNHLFLDLLGSRHKLCVFEIFLNSKLRQIKHGFAI